jgi:hypothetical protein
MQIAFGSGLFYATPLMDAYGNSLASPTPILLGIMQEASVDLSYDSKELFGSEQFAVDAARGQGKLSGTAKAAPLAVECPGVRPEPAARPGAGASRDHADACACRRQDHRHAACRWSVGG